ncbi:cadherin-99C-like [Liolophura sinensis]|uniref:cadherin-99C-like n=1 Tax=Liolophura sinensis TaxID=3198878 RepID=UPI0031584076
MRPPNLHVLLQGSLLLLLVTGVLSQNPCDQIRVPGDSLGIYTVTFEEADPLRPFQPVRQQLMIAGTLGGTISLSLQAPRGNDSNIVTLQPVEDYFQIQNYNNGIYIQMLQGIDRDGTTPSIADDIDEIFYTLLCETFDTPARQIYARLKITITDINDNYPQFIGSPYRVVVNELTPIHTTVFRQLSATDLDSGPAKNVDFYFIKGDGSLNDGTTLFAINAPRLGYITLEEPLDFEEMFYRLQRNTFNLSIEARDNGNPLKKSVSWIEITVQDNDDLGPVFDYPGCLNITQYVPVCINPQYTATVKSNDVNRQPMTIYPFMDAPASPVGYIS